MKKICLKIMSAVLSVVLLIASFSGCTAGTLEADAAQYMTKGEWFSYFASERDLQFNEFENELLIDESSPYYAAVMAIVDNEIIDIETACKDLDKRVNKDVVAYTCINSLPEAYRVSSKRTFKDENRITDVEAAAEAVELGIVEAKSSKKFGADELMSIDQCEIAVKNTVKRIATHKFTKEESNFEIEYQDNVYETNAEVEVVEGSISNYTDYTEHTENNTAKELVDDTDELSVTMLGLKTSTPNVTEVDKKEDVVTIRIPESTYNRDKNAYKVGNIVKVQPFELSADFNNRLRTVECSYLKITLDPIKIGSSYNITGVLPTVDDAFKSVKQGQQATYDAEKGKLTENSGASGVSGLTVTSNGAKFTYTNKAKGKVDLKNGRSDKTDPTLEADFSVSVEISDINLSATGFDTILLDAVFGKPNATLNISYKTNVQVSASFPETRLAPYNNGNGKFPSNLSRSRWTTGNGAKDIKVGKVRYVFGPLVAEFGLYLQIHLDGKITISLEKDTSAIYTIKKSGISKEYISEKSISAEAEVNLYVGAELRGDVHIAGFSSFPLCDLRVGAGFNIQGRGNLFILTTENKYTDKTSTNLSGEELQAITNTYKDTKFGYCLNIKLEFKIYGEIASGNCIIGKAIRFFKKDFEAYGEATFPIFEKHWEDGHEVSKCTREPDKDKKDEEGENIKAGDKIDISNYNLVLDDGTCGMFYVTQVPGTEKNKKKAADRIVVKSTDESVCTATYYKDNHMVEVSTVGEGTCEVRVYTIGAKYPYDLGIKYVSCAIIVNQNKQVAFVPSDTNFELIHI